MSKVGPHRRNLFIAKPIPGPEPLAPEERPPAIHDLHGLGLRDLTDALVKAYDTQEDGSIMLHAQPVMSLFRDGEFRTGVRFLARIGPDLYRSVAPSIGLILSGPDGTSLLGCKYVGRRMAKGADLCLMIREWPLGLVTYLRSTMALAPRVWIHEADDELPEHYSITPIVEDRSVPGDL